MARLKLRELLMPEVVSLVAAEAGGAKAQRVNKVGGSRLLAGCLDG